MRAIIAYFLACFLTTSIIAQPVIDLSLDKQKPEKITLDVKKVKLINKLPTEEYKLVFMVEKTEVGNVEPPPFDTKNFAGLPKDCGCNPGINTRIDNIFNVTEEKTLAKNIGDLRKELSGDDGCKKLCLAKLEKKLEATISEEDLKVTLENDQTITVIVIRKISDTKVMTWTKMLRTPTTLSSRWLTHYGLTYAPNILSKDTLYYSQTDTSRANRFTITEQNNRNPRPWDNISATINFTYPFIRGVRDLNVGFTGGFGLNPGLQLSGHAGFSAVIGTNIILGTGVVLMQKYNLKGEYKRDQVIKENLSFDALHQKVWRPEMFFTIGFRFNKNPFAASEKKETPPASDDKKKTETKPVPATGGGATQ